MAGLWTALVEGTRCAKSAKELELSILLHNTYINKTINY